MYENIRPLQMKQLQILKELKRICEENNLEYFLAYGTLLGAIRHEGFIPWDDDIDVCMKYPDYNRFKEVCKTQLGSDYFLQTDETDPDAGLSYYKLRLNGTTLIVDDLANRDMHHGISIDIYPIYNVPDNLFQSKIQLCATAVYMLFEAGEIPKNHGGIVAMGSRLVLFLFRGNIRNWIKGKCHTYMAKYERKSTNQKALLCCNISVSKCLYPAEIFSYTIKKTFEGEAYSVPSEYDKFLRITYGDYMQLPPSEEQGIKLEHIVKLSLSEPYQAFKGKLYCVSSRGGVQQYIDNCISYRYYCKQIFLIFDDQETFAGEVAA